MRSLRSLAVRAGVVIGAAASAAALVAVPAQAAPAQAVPASESGTLAALRYQYVNVATGKCLDIRGGSYYDYTLVQQFNCKKDAAHQQFWTDTILDDPSTEMRPAHSSSCIEPTNLEAGATIIQRVCNHSQGQRWEFDWSDGRHTIRNRVTGMCLEDAGMPSGSRREVRQMPCNGGPGQLWTRR
ncbi:RICIN domain-containing protein [Streptomyces sp. WM6372]|uniref:RICIN domain-containing protein n=1 Tax=Streptomyces sp. WM6372 TaxID=1415555 RepID=UPI00099D7F66|nr:RICIN domain-containing protein [Streptomyces sp. WM6372]